MPQDVTSRKSDESDAISADSKVLYRYGGTFSWPAACAGLLYHSVGQLLDRVLEHSVIVRNRLMHGNDSSRAVDKPLCGVLHPEVFEGTE
jgi:hypothetical protein